MGDPLKWITTEVIISVVTSNLIVSKAPFDPGGHTAATGHGQSPPGTPVPRHYAGVRSRSGSKYMSRAVGTASRTRRSASSMAAATSASAIPRRISDCRTKPHPAVLRPSSNSPWFEVSEPLMPVQGRARGGAEELCGVLPDRTDSHRRIRCGPPHRLAPPQFDLRTLVVVEQ